jgi:hypothetical protein
MYAKYTFELILFWTFFLKSLFIILYFGIIFHKMTGQILFILILYLSTLPCDTNDMQYNTIQMILLLITVPKIEQNNHNKFSYNDWNDLYD